MRYLNEKDMQVIHTMEEKRMAFTTAEQELMEALRQREKNEKVIELKHKVDRLFEEWKKYKDENFDVWFCSL